MFPLMLKVLKKFSLAFLSHQTLSAYCVLQPSDIPPVSKKLDPGDKANYRPVSVLSLLLKVFEQMIYDQLFEYMQNFESELLWFPKAHSN